MTPRRNLPRLETLAYLSLLALITGASVGSRSPQPQPDISTPPPATLNPAVAEYNPRFGNNRPAGTAALLLARLLYRDGSYWEVYVSTQPVKLGSVSRPDPVAVLRAGQAASSVSVVLATEQGSAVTSFKGKNVQHERSVILDLARLLAVRFPDAAIDFKVLYGESHTHARATYKAGQLTYTVADQS